ncbi:MAG: hypothetical protein ABSG08_15400 [Terriglobales bacterium]
MIVHPYWYLYAAVRVATGVMEIECRLSALLSLTGNTDHRIATSNERFGTLFAARTFPTTDPPRDNDPTDIRGLWIALW